MHRCDVILYVRLTNEFYAKDTSRKIRAVFKAKGQAGKPLCTNPPYGYIKDAQDKTRWIVDESAAEVVRDIFRLCIQGYGVSQIANEITKRHILNPTAHAKANSIGIPDNRENMVTKKSQEELNRSLRDSKRELEQAMSRIHKLDGIIQRLYEDNIEGKVSDERFSRMSASYEEEQHTLESRVAELKALIASEKERSASVDSFLTLVRKYTDIQELTAEVIREFVEKVYVYQTERVGGYKVQRIRIVWNCIGEFTLPSDEGKENPA